MTRLSLGQNDYIWMAVYAAIIYILSTLPFTMEYQKVTIEMKTKHIELLDSLKQEYGCQSRSRALELLLNDLLDPDTETPGE